MTQKTKVKLGRDIEPGDSVMLENGTFARITELIRAPMQIEYEDGTRETPRWAYLSIGGHTTICRDDEVTVKA